MIARTLKRTTAAALIVLAASFLNIAPSKTLGGKSPAPRFTAQTLHGEKVELRDLAGKVVLLNFWATWCDPCAAEIPELEALQKKYGRDDFVLLAINQQEDPVTVASFLREFRLSGKVLMDPTGKLATIYGVEAMPTNVLIDHQGRVHLKSVGYSDEILGSLGREVERLVAEKRQLDRVATAQTR
jgi:thiol-disulfide isomerase/thioredoxin